MKEMTKVLTTNIEPGATVQLWHKETPVIPESGYNTYINNIGETRVVAIYEWKPPLGNTWKEVKRQEFQAGEDGVFQDNGQAFYHQRIVVQNESESMPGCIEWERT